MSEIPEDVRQAACAAMAERNNDPEWYLYESGVRAIARAILAERERCDARIAELERYKRAQADDIMTLGKLVYTEDCTTTWKDRAEAAETRIKGDQT